MSATENLIACQKYVHGALIEASKDRSDRAWVENERLVVAHAANVWAAGHGIARRVTVDDVERLEGPALGHVDYGPKLALYVAEFVAAGESV